MGENYTVLDIDRVLTKTRILAENIQLLEKCKNFTDEESKQIKEGINHLSLQLQRYIPEFKEPSCDKCYNSAHCFKNREPSLRCFQILSEV